MSVTLGTTFWRCPTCKHNAAIDGSELAIVGTPFCGRCQDGQQEMEPLDDPTPTVLFVVDGERQPEYLGVALRPRGMSVRKFQAKITALHRERPSSGIASLCRWLEEKHGVFFLATQRLDVPVGRDRP